MPIIIKYKHKTAELLYTLDVVFGEFLGVDYCFYQSDSDDIHIGMSGSDSEIVLNASFWNNLSQYGIDSKENIPSLPLSEWKFKDNDLSVELLGDSVPVLFGAASLLKKKIIMALGY